MFGEKPVRQSVTPISSAIERNRFLKTSNSTGWMRIKLFLDDQIAKNIQPKTKLGRYDNGRFTARDDCRTRRMRAGQQIIPTVKCRSQPTPSKTAFANR